jgi:acyl-CoA reductase-like NAD-dependent aldehyde dehydrogenase
MGVVGILAEEKSALLGMISLIAPTIAGGNTCIVLASEKQPLCASTFGEVLHASDVPAGVVNILTGSRTELLKTYASHMDVNALVFDATGEALTTIQTEAAANVKRCIRMQDDWTRADSQGPYHILNTQEIKTTWHPIGI